ncbi:ferredoxin [Streptomyces guryensis]|uniref:Ferredoxin n=1 Tax=Streptomyces guryensis TaxID=2886947 RepID=A0A9Q3Z405_9ACTN|nr:ferredoxin [Streptomyces guryensis]MCD9872698.1 ferredoxin [Streptomyces guryensis]
MGVHPARACSSVGAGDRWQVEVDRSVCIGSAQCVHRATGAFRLDSAMQSHPVEPETDADERILQAAENCPVEAIVITLLGSGEPVFPPEE